MSFVVYERAELVRQLRALGLADGDTVLVRVDFGKLGYLQPPGDRTLIASLREVVGARGTLLALTHSPTQFWFRRQRSYVFHPATAPCVSGRFAKAVLRWDGAYRSTHPTCSMAGIGPAARDVLGRHDHRSTCFGPMRGLMAMGGKMLLLGCTESSPGFSTIHYAYEQERLACRSLLSGWIGCYYQSERGVCWFRQRDVPGCSRGFHKAYPLYERHSVLRAGPVGAGVAYCIDADAAFAIERTLVRRRPSALLCDDPHCFSCRATKWFNLADMPRYWCTHVPTRAWKALRRAG